MDEKTIRDKACLVPARYARGEKIKDIFADLKLQPGDFYALKSRDADLATAYSAAIEARTELLMDETVTISDEDTNPHRARNRVQARQFLASRLNRKTFGDQVDVNVSGQIDLRAALSEARARVFRPQRDLEQVIDAEYTMIPSTSQNGTPDNESDAATPDPAAALLSDD